MRMHVRARVGAFHIVHAHLHVHMAIPMSMNMPMAMTMISLTMPMTSVTEHKTIIRISRTCVRAHAQMRFRQDPQPHNYGHTVQPSAHMRTRSRNRNRNHNSNHNHRNTIHLSAHTLAHVRGCLRMASIVQR
jgi:hypothetical protein